MKEKQGFHFSMRVYLIIIVMVELVGIVVVAAMGAALLQYFNITLSIPPSVWLLLISILLGTAATTMLSKWFLAPIDRLSKAMNQVAEGNFDVRLDAKRELREIRDIYANFNLMAQELGATETLQTDFVSNVSHEFKTPINAIEGYATLLQGCEGPTTPEQSQYVDKILFNTRRLSNLVGNILLLSKIDNQAIPAPQTRFRLDEQIRQSIVLLEPEWSKRDMEFDVDLERVEYTGNESLLIHVWNNLIGNAIKFSPQGGEITLRLTEKNGHISFTIEDRGPGIPEGAQKHIFDKFYQGDSSHKEEGNGLGLALVKQILHVSQGEISVENTDSGCRFTVILNTQ